MRLILVHGINQQGKSEAALNGMARPSRRGSRSGRGHAPARCLHAILWRLFGGAAGWPGSSRVSQGPGGVPDLGEAAFLSAALTEQAQAAGIGAKAIAAEERAQSRGPGDATEQGFGMNRRLNAVLRVIERVSPLHGELVMRVLKQAYDYLKRPGVGGAVDAIVRPVLDAGPAVVVGHSLGTVVTFKLLRQLALENRPIKVPLFVTVGSPLPLMAVQAALGPAFSVPTGVGHWLNAVDPDDLIALGRGLDEASFSAGIENLLDIANIEGNPHAIDGYFRDNRVATAIMAACQA